MHPEASKATAPSMNRLEELFATFNQVSIDLGSRYQELQGRVADLSAELAVTHSARVKELTAKEQLAAKLSSLMDTLPGGVIVLDNNGVIRESNSIAVQLLGQPVVGKNWREILAHISDFNNAPDGEFSLNSGRRLCMSSNEFGNNGDLVVLLTDVTENFRLRSLVNREERLSALGEMSARLAHQVRTPLSAAILYLSHITASSDAEHKEQVVKKIHARLHQIENLTDSMLSYIRGETKPRECFSLRSVVVDVKEACSHRVREAKGELLLSLPGDNCLITGDRESIFNALVNLVENALQATTKNAIIRITLTKYIDTYKLVISDNGPGIDADLHEKIFDPFYSGRVGGTGLGMAVVLSAVRSFSGKIAITSAVGGGAQIEIQIPADGSLNNNDSGIWGLEGKCMKVGSHARGQANG